MNRDLSGVGRPKIPEDTETLVSDFFLRQDIVYTSPGLKDEVSVWENGKKVKKRKYYLTLFLREAFTIFSNLHPDIALSFAKFCQLRPKNVYLLKDTPADQCKCKIHENFFLKLKGLGKTYDHSWWEKYLCTSENLFSECWKGVCDNCGFGKFEESCMLDLSKIVCWQQWKKDESTGRIKKVAYETCVGEILENLGESWSVMQEHVRVKRIQETSFEEDKKNHRVLQIDFAMSYSCEYQNEIQSALWSRESVTLFTAAVFHQGTCQSHLICSDTTDKGKDTVFTFLTNLYDRIIPTQGSPDVTDIIYSDGPSSEFKNKYTMKLLHFLSTRYNKTFIWKFFATSHGKGVVDGIGGSAKSLVRTKVMSKNENCTIVQTSAEFAALADSLMPSTTVIHVPDQEIKDLITTLCPWEDVPNVPGIQKVHVAECHVNSDTIKCYHTNGENTSDITVKYTLSGIENNTTNQTDPNVSNNIHPAVGEWWLVNYDDEQFPGEVTKVVGLEIEVSVMVKAGNHWKWPQTPDKIFYTQESMVKEIVPPVVINSRGHFTFSDLGQ